jgi:peptidoglycan-associated lipoprotein
VTEIPTSGLPPTGGDRTNWPQDRETFRDQTVYFDFDQSTVKAGEKAKLDLVATQMKSAHVGKALRIEGHCDERGTEEYNRSLGERRALAVREYLVQQGLDPSIIDTITYGEERPADPGHNQAAWDKNRRGEIILLSPP